MARSAASEGRAGGKDVPSPHFSEYGKKKTICPHPKWRTSLHTTAPAQKEEFCDTNSPGVSSPTPAPTSAGPRPSHLRPEVTYRQQRFPAA